MPDPAELSLLRLARRTENDQLLLQAGWPARVRLAAPQNDKDPSMLPYLFAPAFTPLDDAVLRRFAVACRLMAGKTRLRGDALRAQAVQLELHAILAGLFPARTEIWDVLRAIESRYAWGLGEDEVFRSGRRAVAELTDEDARELARANVPALRLAVAGLALLAPDEAPLHGLSEAVDAYAGALALLDALRSWKNDAAAGRATFVTARLARELPGETDPARLGAMLYARGIASEVFDDALASCERAYEALAFLRAPIPWARAPLRLADQARERRAALAAALAAQRPRAAAAAAS